MRLWRGERAPAVDETVLRGTGAVAEFTSNTLRPAVDPFNISGERRVEARLEERGRFFDLVAEHRDLFRHVDLRHEIEVGELFASADVTSRLQPRLPVSSRSPHELEESGD